MLSFFASDIIQVMNFARKVYKTIDNDPKADDPFRQLAADISCLEANLHDIKLQVDALCIQQQDSLERRKQICQMDRNYKNYSPKQMVEDIFLTLTACRDFIDKIKEGLARYVMGRDRRLLVRRTMKHHCNPQLNEMLNKMNEATNTGCAILDTANLGRHLVARAFVEKFGLAVDPFGDVAHNIMHNNSTWTVGNMDTIYWPSGEAKMFLPHACPHIDTTAMWVAENLQRRELELDPDAKFLARHCAALWRFECVPSPSLTQNLSRWDQGDTTFKTPDPRILDSSQEFDILLGKPFLQRSMISRRINLEYFDDIKGYVDERFGNNGGLPSFIPFIAGTLADGGSLLDYWKRGNEKPRSLEPILWSLRQMCSLAGALYSLHHEHCRHGDLKPANILRLEEDSDRESSRIKLSRECSTLKDETAQQYEIGLLNDSEWKREVQSARANLKVQHQYFRLPSSSVLKDFARLVTNQVNKFRSLLLQLQFQSLTRKRSSSGVMQFGKTGLLSVLSWVSPVTATSVGTGNHSCASFLTALHHELHELRRLWCSPQPPFRRSFSSHTILLGCFLITTFTVILYTMIVRTKPLTKFFLLIGILGSTLTGAIFAVDVPDFVFRYLSVGTNVALVGSALYYRVQGNRKMLQNCGFETNMEEGKDVFEKEKSQFHD